jgi:hypothetical protein
MQATARFHDGVTSAILQKADLVFHDPLAFHPTHSMFRQDADGRAPTIRRFLRRCEFPTTWFLPGLDNHDGQDESLNAHILIETTAKG